MSTGLININNEFNIEGKINIQIDVIKCNGCIPRIVQKDISIELEHEKAIHKDFGIGFNGWLSASQCSLGNECKSQYTRTLNRGCSICNAIIHEGECMRIHKNQELNKEKKNWMKSNIELVAKYYKKLKKRGVLTEETYKETIKKLQNYII